MTTPTWPYTMGKMKFELTAGVPQAAFDPDFGPAIQRPRSTAIVERASFEIMFSDGTYPAFRTWWATTAKGGDFVWTRPDTGESVIVRPVNGSYSATSFRGRDAAAGQNEIMRVAFSGDLLPAPAS